MAGKQPTQGVVDDGLKGAPDGTNRPVEKSAALNEPGSAGAGGNPDGGQRPFRGGQSSAGYHGPGKLGDQKIESKDATNRSAGSD
jgi:hypothetical protein